MHRNYAGTCRLHELRRLLHDHLDPVRLPDPLRDGLNSGGPVIITWGWPFVGVMTLFVGLAMAEVCSSFPTAGGLYYWSAKLAPSNPAAWSWFTGWFNFLGQVAVTAGIDFGAAFFLNALLDLQWGFDTRPWHTIVLFAAILLLHGVVNQFGVRIIAVLNNISVWWHILGVLIIVSVLAFVPAHHQSASWVFSHYVNNTGWGSKIYVLLLGLLLAQYTFTGYDASAHMTEETRSAARSGPRGIVMSIVVSLFAGWLLLIGITFAIQNYSGAASASVPAAQVFIQALGNTGTKLLLLVVIGAQLFCGMSSVTANSRMIYAFSRDVAVTSIAVIGLYVAYVMPTFLRLRLGSRFKAGPWQLGRWSRPIGIIACVWVAFIFVLFMLPTVSPITHTNFNYTVVAVVVVLGFAGIWWLVSAHKWFTGPKVQGTPEELAEIENELESLA
jgi:amino acid transporter